MMMIPLDKAVTYIRNGIGVFVLLVFTIVSSSGNTKENVKPDFSSPIKTIITYYEYLAKKDRIVVSNCFHPSEINDPWGKRPSFNGPLGKFWLEYKILDQKKMEEYSRNLINGDVVDLYVEEKMDDPEKNNPKAQFWYSLQKINNKWKIIVHSMIFDENYPDPCLSPEEDSSE